METQLRDLIRRVALLMSREDNLTSVECLLFYFQWQGRVAGINAMASDGVHDLCPHS